MIDPSDSPRQMQLQEWRETALREYAIELHAFIRAQPFNRCLHPLQKIKAVRHNDACDFNASPLKCGHAEVTRRGVIETITARWQTGPFGKPRRSIGHMSL